MSRKKNKPDEDVHDLESDNVDSFDAAKSSAVAETEVAIAKPVEPAEKNKAASESVVYIGPNLPGGKLFQFAVFRNGLPVYAEKLVDECPALKFLFVIPSRLSVARQNLGNKSSVEAAKFAEATRHFQKGVK